MTAWTGTLLLAASLAVLPPAVAVAMAAGQRADPPAPLSLLDVPYLSQSEALCGGAAAAMVLRYWGAAGVGAEDFAPLVDASKGGIETGALVRAVEARGYRARAAAGSAAIVQRELAAGRPVIALIEDRPGALHYVVVVGWHARAVVLHDPARTPFTILRPEAFLRRWGVTGSWMLAIAPARSPEAEPAGEPTAGAAVAKRGPAAPDRCTALVADGVRLAQQKDLDAAERLLADAAFSCDGAAPLRELAGVRLLQRRWPEVRDLAGRAVEIDATDAHAWRLLATARFIAGDQPGALDAWNRAGEPTVDLVSVSGLQRTSHRAVERYLDIQPASILTRRDLERARRRLAELPAALATSLEYVPRPSGLADVRAHVVERALFPTGRLEWTAIGLRAAVSREIGVGASGLARNGERLDARWRFWPNRPAAGVALAVPAPFGLFTLEAAGERQPFTLAALPEAERVSARAGAGDWATSGLRWQVTGGFDRWRGDGSFGVVGGALRLARGRVRAGIEGEAWMGTRTFAAGLVQAGWRSSSERRGFVVDASSMAQTIGAAAPLDLWPAGDTGHARRAVLRAHPLLDEGRLRVERLGRHLAQLSAEAQFWARPVAAVPVAAAVFVDAARVAARPRPAGDARPLADVDAGVGARIALGRAGVLRVDWGHGLRDGRNALSARWTRD